MAWSLLANLVVLMPCPQGHVLADSPPCEATLFSSPAGKMADRFGQGVALSNNVAAIGDSVSSTGAVYMFRHDGNEWVQEAVLESPRPDPKEGFGNVNAMSGNVVLVAAQDAAAPELLSGAVYVYQFNPDNAQWEFEIRLTASDGDFNDSFGFSVAIDGDVALIGARDDENEGMLNSGSAYVFRYDGVEWVEEQKLTDPNGQELDLFGRAVALNGNVAVIGAPGNEHPDFANGSAFVFRYNGTDWVLEAELAAFDQIGKQRFGTSVAVAQDTAVVGATHDDGQAGAAYVFHYDGTQWNEEARLTGSDPVDFPAFGIAASISDDAKTVLIGAYHDSALGFDAGAAYVFRYDDNDWNEIAKLTASNGSGGALFGAFLSISGDSALIGAPGQSRDMGHAYLFVGLSGLDCNSNDVADACDILDRSSQDANGNGVPDECEAAGDLDGDGRVGIVDFLILLANWGDCDKPCPPNCVGDIDGSCAVDGVDLLLLFLHWDFG